MPMTSRNRAVGIAQKVAMPFRLMVFPATPPLSRPSYPWAPKDDGRPEQTDQRPRGVPTVRPNTFNDPQPQEGADDVDTPHRPHMSCRPGARPRASNRWRKAP